jgi:hypothetical protein
MCPDCWRENRLKWDRERKRNLKIPLLENDMII